MTDAERQAHAAGEFDEAAAMRRREAEGRPEASLLVNAWLGSIEPTDEGALLYVERQELLTVRAVLERQVKLEGALREIVSTPSTMTYGDLTGPVGPPHAYIVPAEHIEKAKALLARSAAEGSERG